MSSDESERMRARLAIFEAAQDMLAGRLSYIEGARKIHSARFSWGLVELDADVRCFVGIDSETDALPLGEMRGYWQAADLKALQPEIDKKEAWAKKLAEHHCYSLVQRFLSGEIEIKSVEHYDCRVVLLAAASGDYRTENLVCFNSDGSVRWRAALPSNTGPDSFVNATVDENNIRADSWSGWAIWFDHETGAVKKSEFVK
jgi:outer membrane protein assembly factor BamB